MIPTLLCLLVVTYLWAGLSMLKAVIDIVDMCNAVGVERVAPQAAEKLNSGLASVRGKIAMVLIWPAYLPIRAFSAS